MEPVNERPAEANLGTWVGTVMRWDSKTGKTSDPMDIYSNVETLIGRDRRYCQYSLGESYISGKHIRLYTVIFDEGRPDDVSPLVYAQDLSLNGTYWNEYRMRKGTHDNYLLTHGDILRLGPKLHIRFQSSMPSFLNKFTSAQIAEMDNFRDTYVITHRLLGSGAFGRVHMAYKKGSGHQLACKVIDLEGVKNRAMADIHPSKFFPNSAQSLDSGSTSKTRALKAVENYVQRYIQRKTQWYEREASILAKLSHPNIIQVEKIIRSENALYIFSEILTGGDLFSFIAHHGGKLDEFTTSLVIRQVLLALEYLHDRNIVHRDIKPDNILMSSLRTAERVVLTDFGCAKRLSHPDQRISTRVGTLQYCAPELNRANSKGYGKAVDLWSLGCVMAVMLVGYAPFDDPYINLNSEMESLEDDLKRLGVSILGRGFLSSLLIPDEQLRMDTKEALTHPWLAAPSQERRLESIHKNMLLEWEPKDDHNAVIVDIDNLDGDDARVASISSTPEPEQIITPPICRLQSIDHVSETTVSESAVKNNVQLRSPVSLSSPATRKDPKPAPQQSKASQMVPTAVAPKATHTIVISSDQVASISPISPVLQNPASRLDTTPTACKPQRSIRSRRRMILRPRPSLGDTSRPEDTSNTTSMKGLYDIPCDEDEEQVYEEVCNPVTGKRKRLIYGQDEERVKRLLA